MIWGHTDEPGFLLSLIPLNSPLPQGVFPCYNHLGPAY